MTVIEKFLNLYKDYETCMREKGIDCKDYEESVDDLMGNRLKICRIFRNYLSHNNDKSFLDVSENQIRFLEKLVAKLKQEKDILKKHVKTSGTLTFKTRCSEAAVLFKKTGSEDLLLNDNGYGLVSVFDVVVSLAESKTAKIDSVKIKKKGFIFLSPDTLMNDVPDDTIVVCTDNGKKDGKYMGVYYGNSK